MTFNSIDFLIFFPIVTGVYFCIPRKLRRVWLLVSSYYFSMAWNPKYAVLIALSTVITYTCSLLLDHLRRNGQDRYLKAVVAFCACSNLGILALFKYGNFFLENLYRVLSAAGFGVTEHRLDLLLPVGISFYTFQALSYTFDVYAGKIAPERSLLKYALYVSFFPQLVAGPIERSTSLLPQIQDADKTSLWDLERVRDGFMLMAWGLFQKLVIADRLSVFVEAVTENCQSYGFLEIAVAAVFFAFQIYCDFGGYTNIARGAARVLGFRLMNNFRQPYFAVSIKDFWRRWHISLTTWFTDYLYIPLGGNRKGRLRKYLNILIVFAVSGLWHGASWNYVVWGLLHGVYRVVGELFGNVRRKMDNTQPLSRTVSAFVYLRKLFVTFVLVDFGWIFFMSGSLSNALALIRQMVSSVSISGFRGSGLGRIDLICLVFGLLVLFLVDLLHEKRISVFGAVAKMPLPVRWSLYMGLLWATIMLRIYGDVFNNSTFIYFQF